MTDGYSLINGDCLTVMKDIPDKSIDMVCCDLPYGTTACKWDNVIPFESLWEQYNRIIKDNGAICLFGSEPFSSKLRMSNLKHFKYDWIWEKHKPSNFALAKKQPLKYHETISVFYKKQCCYNPQMIPRESRRVQQGQLHNEIGISINKQQLNNLNNTTHDYKIYDANLKLPSSIIKNPAVVSTSKENVGHPTQKPVALLEYLIKTYTTEGETVLDNCMGSGSTGVACLNTNRKFIGIELDQNYFEIAQNRLAQTK